LAEYDVNNVFIGYGLINMNGRLYDPKVHRFLMPDRDIQDPYNTKSYNRYGYVLNNPLKYIDPTGEDSEGNPPNGGCVECSYSGYASLVASIFQTLHSNWDDWGIKDWSNRNLNIKNIGNSVSDGLKSGVEFITRNFQSLLDDVGGWFGISKGGGNSPVIYKTSYNGPLPNIASMNKHNILFYYTC
jgi:RHS repeat-associated protein